MSGRPPLPRVKICGIRSREDLEAVARSGADAAGFLVGQRHASPDFIAPAAARALAARLPPKVQPVLVTHLNQPGHIRQILAQTKFNTVQLHGAPTPEQVCELRTALGNTTLLILAIHVVGSRIQAQIQPFTAWIDAVILDTADPAGDRVGGTGRTHDWRIAARFARRSPKPCLLAGGLTPENVAQAVNAVRPHGVDVNTGVERPDGGKDPRRCAEFAQTARTALAAIAASRPLPDEPEPPPSSGGPA